MILGMEGVRASGMQLTLKSLYEGKPLQIDEDKKPNILFFSELSEMDLTKLMFSFGDVIDFRLDEYSGDGLVVGVDDKGKLKFYSLDVEGEFCIPVCVTKHLHNATDFFSGNFFQMTFGKAMELMPSDLLIQKLFQGINFDLWDSSFIFENYGRCVELTWIRKDCNLCITFHLKSDLKCKQIEMTDLSVIEEFAKILPRIDELIEKAYDELSLENTNQPDKKFTLNLKECKLYYDDDSVSEYFSYYDDNGKLCLTKC